MSLIKVKFLLFLLICRVSHSQRRIINGQKVITNQPYVVYFLKASLSARTYDHWICGGALVTSEFIITSAACVEDVRYLYAVAGTNKYVGMENIKNDLCVNRMKKKVVFTCVPTSYTFDFDRIEKWSMIDIALARVESPYNFKDKTVLDVCPYVPTKIAINYDDKYQMPDTDCMVMGWGHNKKFRKESNTDDLNSETLQYTSTLIIDQQKCLKGYEYYTKMKPVIEQYMICTEGEGGISDSGLTRDQKWPLMEGCVPSPSERRMDDNYNSSCTEPNEDDQNTDYMNGRRGMPQTNRTYYNYTTQEYIRKAARERFASRTRRQGICQNDHGGPLVTWVGATEVLIGVASVFQIDENYKCIGPFLHTSTKNNGAFIDCILNDWGKKKKQNRRNALCDSPPNVRGFDKIDTYISWKDHPAGPAENELREAKLGSSYNNEPLRG